REEHWVIADLRPTYGLRHPAAGSNPSAWKTSRSCIAFCGTFNEGFPTIPPHKRRCIYERKITPGEFIASIIGSPRRDVLKCRSKRASIRKSGSHAKRDRFCSLWFTSTYTRLYVQVKVSARFGSFIDRR